MKIVKILGPGCKKCKQLEANAKQAISELKQEIKVLKIEDMEEIVKYGALSTPGLVINEKLISAGKMYGVEELKTLLSN